MIYLFLSKIKCGTAFISYCAHNSILSTKSTSIMPTFYLCMFFFLIFFIAVLDGTDQSVMKHKMTWSFDSINLFVFYVPINEVNYSYVICFIILFILFVLMIVILFPKLYYIKFKILFFFLTIFFFILLFFFVVII